MGSHRPATFINDVDAIGNDTITANRDIQYNYT
jgi:hypothetical protein